MKKLFILFSFALILGGCEKKDDQQRIYFEHIAINNAWGLSYVHWIIDNDGKVLTNHKKDIVQILNSNNQNQGFEVFDSIIYKIDNTELQQYVALIEPASKGQIDSVNQSRADFGGTVYNCYLYNKSNSSYKTILLSEMSDYIDKFNRDSNAVKIDDWLKAIHYKIYSKD